MLRLRTHWPCHKCRCKVIIRRKGMAVCARCGAVKGDWKSYGEPLPELPKAKKCCVMCGVALKKRPYGMVIEVKPLDYPYQSLTRTTYLCWKHFNSIWGFVSRRAKGRLRRL